MKKASSSSLEDRTSEFLTALLMDVPILRAQGTPEEYLDTLERAVLYHPVFPNWPSPMDDWLAEAEQLSRDLNRLETLASVMLRRAVVHMRRLEYDEALAELERVRHSFPHLSPAHLTLYTATRVRILTRQQRFEEARQALGGIASPPQEEWIAPLPLVALGELHVEANEIEVAEKTLRHALTALPFELVEERIQVLQLLGFVSITQADAPKALEYLDQARQMLRGAGAWVEVIQANLAAGSFQVAAGRQAAAQDLFAEALELCRQYPQPQLETLLRLGLARSKAAVGQVDQAVAAGLQVAKLYAEQGNIVGYISMIVFVANLYAQDKNYAEAYRTLATGIAIVRQRQWRAAETVLRAQINRLRNEVVGPTLFDAIVQEMIDRRRGDR